MIMSDDIEACLLSMADEVQARQLMRFFKTGPGQYGEGDKFIGLKNPQVRMVVKESWRETSLDECTKLVKNPIHEVRLCGLLIMVEKYLKFLKKKDSVALDEIFNTYINLHEHINNWDLVDLSAIKIVGNHEHLHPELTLMDEWILPNDHTLWQQRISMVSTWILTRKTGSEKCFARAECMLDSSHDLLHKAAGWMMREAWKKGYRDELREFLHCHIERMPSIMLSYATEQMSPDERHEWQLLRKTNIHNKRQRIGLF